jgi:hypothetical protein
MQVQHAILAGKTDLLWALKAAGADVNAQDAANRGTPLRFAIAMRCVQTQKRNISTLDLRLLSVCQTSYVIDESLRQMY